jgi:hypothetical protein
MSESQHQAIQKRYFDEVHELSYAINNATTRKEWQALGKRLVNLGNCMKYEAKSKTQYRISHGVEE